MCHCIHVTELQGKVAALEQRLKQEILGASPSCRARWRRWNSDFNQEILGAQTRCPMPGMALPDACHIVSLLLQDLPKEYPYMVPMSLDVDFYL